MTPTFHHDYHAYFLGTALRRQYTSLMLKTLSRTCSTCGSRPDYATLFKPGPGPCKLTEGELCPPCLELEEFDRECQAILLGLTERRRGIVQRINQCHDPFIQRLPLELASKIFSLCRPEYVPRSEPLFIPLLWDASKMSHIKPFNIILGSICQSWRHIAWSTPALWSTLPIRLHRWSKRNRVDLTLEWLGRSAQIPLNVVIACDSRMKTAEVLTQENVSLWKPLVDIANGCSDRWRSLLVDVPELVYSYIVGNGEATSILEGLKFGSAHNRRFSARFSLTEALPTPTRLVLCTMPLRSVDIGWSNLTCARINHLYVNECLVLLQQACRLTTFSLDGLLQGRDELLPAPSPTIHHTLRHFDVFELVEKQSAQQLLDFISLPALKNLAYDSDFNSLDNVSAFLHRSGCRLTSLLLKVDDPDHFSGLALSSDLQSLEGFIYHGHMDGLLHYLNKPPNEQDGSIFLPKLCKIQIWGDQTAWSSLADLYLFRPLRSLSIYLETPINRSDKTSWPDKETALRFQNLVQKGHRIRIVGQIFGENRKDRNLLPWIVETRMSETRTAD